MSCWIETVKDWQTLVAGILAILAAFVGGAFVSYQTGAVERRERARMDRQHAAARAVVPLALSTLMEYAQDCAIALDGLVVTIGGAIARSASTSFTPPTLDPSVVTLLSNVIENGDANITDAVCVLISDIQIFSANLRRVSAMITAGSTSVSEAHNILSYTLRAAAISARAAELFPYARRKTKTAKSTFPTQIELLTTLNLMGFDDSTHPVLYSEAKRLTKFQEAERAKAPKL